jgi:hypothetical protein
MNPDRSQKAQEAIDKSIAKTEAENKPNENKDKIIKRKGE